MDSILNNYGKLQERFTNMGWYGIDEKVSKICNGFKIADEMLDRSFNTLSGGEKTIVNLASLIISNPNILLLDEPTNHLDIDTKEMLEEALNEYQGTLFFISHDIYFINKLAQRVINGENEKFQQYIGNYDYFKKQKVKNIISNEISQGRKNRR